MDKLERGDEGWGSLFYFGAISNGVIWGLFFRKIHNTLKKNHKTFTTDSHKFTRVVSHNFLLHLELL